MVDEGERAAWPSAAPPDSFADLVQDCFVRLHSRWGRIDDPVAYLRRSAEEESARAAIADTFVAAYDGLADDDRADLYQRPDVWQEANARFRENDSYADMATTIHAEVREIVFTAPDRATVRCALLSNTDGVPEPGEQIGEAVLIDGTWKVSIETSCRLLRLGGVECEL